MSPLSLSHDPAGVSLPQLGDLDRFGDAEEEEEEEEGMGEGEEEPGPEQGASGGQPS